MERTIIVGDVHGCYKELTYLLKTIAYKPSDRLIFVGDLIARGPDSLGVLKLVREIGALVVRGNHEEKLLLWRTSQEDSNDYNSKSVELLPMHLAIAQALTEEDWMWMHSFPLWYALPEHELLVVHAGLVPGITLACQDRKVLLSIRGLTEEKKPCYNKNHSQWWGRAYKGPPHIVFGHNAFFEPQFHPWATGIDTACVYGGMLTAMVLQKEQVIPRGQAVKKLLISQSSMGVYYPY
ncbi:metallophosphoesterase family protein [Candidatus Cardinium hertigii]|uniref:Serine/threonine protein phosphatase n=1 Tax=Candidatus Cardinium hertigii TaxID=247481 RepID=A0A3N2QC64_9BACT|nr:metallophosphoesterase family protein [Candidatus Cardinium hertigii]ROT47398.1 serine/threonine protein phosphatase [Candidatus Cardinium hertigii]